MSSDMAQISEDIPAPDASRSEEGDIPSYYEAFPPLSEGESPRAGASASTPAAAQWGPTNKMMLRTSTTTQVFRVPLEERRFQEINEHGFGEAGEQAKICKDIMQKTGVAIEMSLAKDQSLTVVITGKIENVMKARRMVVNQLQTQANVTMKIPREHHRFILGKSGKKLQELELNTTTKITIPRPEENSDVIRIVGTKEGIDKARHELQLITDEQAKLAFERLPIAKIYHPFICGPNNALMKELQDKTGARIHVPPPSVMKDEIVVSGEKEGVHEAKATIMKIYEEKKRKCQTVSVEVRKSQHKYVIGPRAGALNEILQATGVSVEVPPLDSPSETITLRGEQDKLGPALTMVYSKANSVVIAEVVAPAWLHRFIIGRQGATIRKITQDLPKVHIEFTEGQDKIVIEGPPDEVEQAQKALGEITQDLQTRMAYAELDVNQKYHKHIIGKNGANITRIKNDTGVAIRIPSDSEGSRIIRIEGDPKGVEKAKAELMEMVEKMENERSKDIMIEQRFHRTIIGAKGDKIKEVRDKFNQVQITFPDPGKKSNIVTLRGPKNDVEKCYKYLQQMHQELIAVNYQAEVHIFKQFHKNIIGKGGATIKKIREETDTRIDLPSEASDSDVIVITGKRQNVETAKAKIEAIQKELANIKEITIEIPHKHHNSIIGAKGRLIRSIMEDCGGVIVRFPPEGGKSDKVVLRGPKDDVEKAKKELLALADERQTHGFTAEIKAKPDFHKFLIGRNGANIRKVRESTGARVIFPTSKDADQETISIIGTEESVSTAKTELEAMIKELENVVEGEISVDPKYHRHFVARRGEVLHTIAADYGGVSVSFPRSGMKSDKVVLKGAKDCIEGAKKRIAEIVAELESQVTIECVIPQQYHRTVMGTKGSRVQEVTKDHNVGIKFPDRPQANGAGDGKGNAKPQVNGDVDVNGDTHVDGAGDAEHDQDKPKKQDIILITGKKEDCEAAKEALMALVPITEEVNVPFDFHRFIIGQRGRDVRKMMEEFDVNISIPPADNRSDIVKVTGPRANVARAVEGLNARVEELEKEKEDRALKNFSLEVRVDPAYHPKIIGRRGAVISKIRDAFDVNIQFPDKGSENQDVITITGYEKSAKEAKDEIMKLVGELDNMITEEVNLDHRVHSRIIGQKGRQVRKIMDDYKVDIKFPRSSDNDNPDLVVITGMEDNVLDAKDYLQNLEEEYLQDVLDRESMRQYMHPSKQEQSHPKQNHGPGFQVRDAPWDKQAPNMESTEDFPSFASGGGGVAAGGGAPSWGPGSRRF
ncbi:vigilin [Lingula anatina]|uniref:Vigilin n=1 Tax=Lingula anatina TaxID=7574 RepID=A0A1S3I7W9_LINAN|nr:vigilin [Lingula anatina]XP_013393956.1 vigilin [Lingula anatina]|eukprot:XP_013393954.1 vigilin [Lingula anatina]